MSEESEDKPPAPKAAPVEPKPSTRYADADRDLGFGNPLLEKIRKLLVSTDPECWNIGGEDFSSELRVLRPQTTHEQVLVRDIPNGSLVLHCVQPVSSQYLPGGYGLIESAPPIYTIEVRDRIFDPNKMVDPKYAANQKGKRCDVVASGEIAKSLFIQVRETIRSHLKEKRRLFDEKVSEISPRIIDVIDKSDFSSWEKKSETIKEEQHLSYTAQLQGLSICALRITKDWESRFQLILGDGKFSNSSIASATARTCFQRLEELEQNFQLTQLADRLKGLGLEE